MRKTFLVPFLVCGAASFVAMYASEASAYLYRHPAMFALCATSTTPNILCGNSPEAIRHIPFIDTASFHHSSASHIYVDVMVNGPNVWAQACVQSYSAIAWLCKDGFPGTTSGYASIAINPALAGWTNPAYSQWYAEVITRIDYPNNGPVYVRGVLVD